MNVDSDITHRIDRIFESKKWPKAIKSKVLPNVYENFSEVIERLNPEQTELFLQLSEDFKWYMQDKYWELLTKAFDKTFESEVFAGEISNSNTVYLIPSKKEAGRIRE